MKNFNLDFKSYDDSDESYRLFYKILYELVKKYPRHNNNHEIVTKIKMIGETHSASIRRNRSSKTIGETSKKIDYYKDVAPIFINLGPDIDKKIKEIKHLFKKEKMSNKVVEKVLSLHGWLMNEINANITDDNKRSFVSKYLHYHLPECVFIYDSITNSSITKYVRKIKGVKAVFPQDQVYKDYVYRCLKLYDEIVKSKISFPSKDTLPRVIDNFLLRNKEEKENK